jgi:gamma-glutamyltranspeptidase/glutathione hydrolase
VLEPAIRLARDGFPVGAYLAWALVEYRAQGGGQRAGEFESIFYPGGHPLAAGTPLVQSDLARTLESIREQGAAALQAGPIAAAMCETVLADGGVLEPSDLVRNGVTVEPPAKASFAGASLYGPSPAHSGTGVLYAALEEVDPRRLGENRSPQYVTTLADALRKGWNARRAGAAAAAAQPHTTHLCAAGPDGDLVALTFTHGPWFGSALVAAGTGIVLNGGANVFAPSGSGGYAATNMAPVVLDGPDGSRHALGATGGPRIPALILSAVVDVVCFGATLDEAIAAPHVSVLPEDGQLEVESALCAPGGPAEGALTMGPGQFGPAFGITRSADGYRSGVDRRFEHGLAIG